MQLLTRLKGFFTSILKHTNLCCLFEWCSHYSGETTFTFSLLLQPFWLQSPSKFIPCLPWSDCNQDWFAPKYDILLLITQQQLLTLHPSATTIHNNSIKRPTIEIWVGCLNSFRLTCFNLTLCFTCIVHYFFFSYLRHMVSTSRIFRLIKRVTYLICNYLWPNFWTLHRTMSPFASIAFCAWQLQQLLRGNAGNLFCSAKEKWEIDQQDRGTNSCIMLDQTWRCDVILYDITKGGEPAKKSNKREGNGKTTHNLYII